MCRLEGMKQEDSLNGLVAKAGCLHTNMVLRERRVCQDGKVGGRERVEVLERSKQPVVVRTGRQRVLNLDRRRLYSKVSMNEDRRK